MKISHNYCLPNPPEFPPGFCAGHIVWCSVIQLSSKFPSSEIPPGLIWTQLASTIVLRFA